MCDRFLVPPGAPHGQPHSVFGGNYQTINLYHFLVSLKLLTLVMTLHVLDVDNNFHLNNEILTSDLKNTCALMIEWMCYKYNKSFSYISGEHVQWCTDVPWRCGAKTGWKDLNPDPSTRLDCHWNSVGSNVAYYHYLSNFTTFCVGFVIFLIKPFLLICFKKKNLVSSFFILWRTDNKHTG